MASSLSYAPQNYCRQGVRLTEPDSRTIEQIVGANLSVVVTMPFDTVNQYASMIPNVGLDTLTINYTDYQGNALSFSRSVNLWMSDAGYVFLSADQGTQFLIAGVSGDFFDQYAAQINTRNASLVPCSGFSSSASPVRTSGFSSGVSSSSAFSSSSLSQSSSPYSSSSAVATGLLPCCNARRYDADTLIPDQDRPTLWIRDGSSMSAG